jgi:hypothetical protein
MSLLDWGHKTTQIQCTHRGRALPSTKFGLVSGNALGSRNANGRLSQEQTSERIVAVWGKRPNARLPAQVANDKGRLHISVWIGGLDGTFRVEAQRV